MTDHIVCPLSGAPEGTDVQLEDDEHFDLDEELKHVVGLEEVKVAIRGIATTLKVSFKFPLLSKETLCLRHTHPVRTALFLHRSVPW